MPCQCLLLFSPNSSFFFLPLCLSQNLWVGQILYNKGLERGGMDICIYMSGTDLFVTGACNSFEWGDSEPCWEHLYFGVDETLLCL